MTDEQMDARLRRAGEAWRAADPGEAVAVLPHGQPHDVITHGAASSRRRHWALLASAAAIVAALVAGGTVLVANFGSSGNKPQPVQAGPIELVGTTWKLAAATDATGQRVSIAGSPSLTIDDAHLLSGSDGCNHLSGEVAVDQSVLGFGSGVATTEVACPDAAVTRTAKQVDAMLSGKVTWSIEDGQLTLTKAGTGTLVYDATTPRTPSTDPAGLIGVTWHLVSVETTGGNSASSARPRNTKITLVLRGNTFELDAWCYAAAGSYTTDGDKLTLNQEGATFGDADACYRGDASNAAVKLIDGTVKWQLTDGNLRLTKGDTAAVFASQGAAPAATPLLGTSWEVSDYSTSRKLPHGDYGPVPGATVTVTISKTGYEIDTRCLDYRGSVQFDGTKVVLENPARVGGSQCDNPAIDDTVAVLPGDYQWVIVGKRLTLHAQDQTTITLEG